MDLFSMEDSPTSVKMMAVAMSKRESGAYFSGKPLILKLRHRFLFSRSSITSASTLRLMAFNSARNSANSLTRGAIACERTLRKKPLDIGAEFESICELSPSESIPVSPMLEVSSGAIFGAEADSSEA
ncbi:uncharacterized protein RB166_002339 isoform 2-T2 [Leptodactylus fuscus]